MSTGLDYFKKVYDVVPGWVQKMHDYNPAMLDHYTALRGAAMAEGVLSVKEKDILLVGINSSRHYARSMVYHTKGAIDGGATLEELAEYLLVAYNYGGEKALQIGLQSFEYALELTGTQAEKISHDAKAVDIVRYYAQFASTDASKNYYEQLISFFVDGNENALSEKLLETNVVDEQMKYILMTGIYTTVLKNAETDYWAKKARGKGVDEPRLAELGYICLLTAGIPSWFEISDALIEK
ncbi:Carboxymuconolactone decarboxylase family protein [Psychrobacillus sp. OK028]|uniref:carboxymuconolactone decarboxylase family protein n=1 Tax=Psychrobacillus sp. OK028 TaxID=1884359 RepID=UPI0008872B8E|nr:carboxymuconolactone decarboxylase family protein [Psychrobacillus sp. OK028]SDN75142.1 Carboxymuconolactone decarboxylase family protein [Psychrobacillus sp. OK028]